MKQPKPPDKILIVRLSAHGDVIQTLPLLADLRAIYPDAMIGWLVERSAAPLLAAHPLIDHLHICDRKAWLKALPHPTRWLPTLREVIRFLRELKAPGYTISLDVQGLLKSAIWPLLAGIPQRWGFKATREGADRCYTHCLPPHDMSDPDTPTVEIFRRFAKAISPEHADHLPLGFPLAPVSSQTQQKVAILLQPIQGHGPVLALAPATIWPSKHWPVEHWQALLKKLSCLPIRIIFLGGPSDRALLEQIQASVHAPVAKILNLGGQTDLPDLVALFGQVDCFVGPDSAPLHIAAAVAYKGYKPPQTLKPSIIGLFGPTAPGRTGPLSPPDCAEPHAVLHTQLPCQPCFERRCPLPAQKGFMACMAQLSVEQVLQTLYACLQTK